MFPLVLALLPACASIVEGDRQVLSVESPNCPGALCKLSNNQGMFYVPKTPGTVSINKSASSMIVECSRGEHSQVITVESSTKAMTFGNILFGGIIGGAVDMSTGAAYEYDALVQHPLSCRSQTQSKVEANGGRADTEVEAGQ